MGLSDFCFGENGIQAPLGLDLVTRNGKKMSKIKNENGISKINGRGNEIGIPPSGPPYRAVCPASDNINEEGIRLTGDKPFVGIFEDDIKPIKPLEEIKLKNLPVITGALTLPCYEYI